MNGCWGQNPASPFIDIEVVSIKLKINNVHAYDRVLISLFNLVLKMHPPSKGWFTAVICFVIPMHKNDTFNYMILN